MFPPPMTTAVSTPSAWTSATSWAILISGDRVDPERLFTHQGFAGELEEDAAIGGFGHGRKGL